MTKTAAVNTNEHDPKPKRRASAKKADAPALSETNETKPAKLAEPAAAAPPEEKPKRRRVKRPPRPEPVHGSPKAELKRLVREYGSITKNARRHLQSCQDKECRFTHEIIPCPLPEEIKEEIRATAKRLKNCAHAYHKRFEWELEKTPIYRHFLSNVYGMGPVAGAYLVANIDITKATKVSNLIRYCGNACNANGKAERRSGAAKELGGTGTFNDKIKSALWQVMAAMWKNAARTSKDAPHGHTTKYLTRWRDAKRGLVSIGQVKGSHDKGRRKATDLLIEDLYIVWRTLEGLPVWCSWYASKRMHEHGGTPIDPTQPRILTLDEALSIVGYVGKTPLAEKYVDPCKDLGVEQGDEPEDELEEEAAE